jgi:hypothetical protein
MFEVVTYQIVRILNIESIVITSQEVEIFVFLVDQFKVKISTMTFLVETQKIFMVYAMLEYSQIIYIVALKLQTHQIYIIHIFSNPAPSVSAVSDLKINLTASSINNTARKNDMRKWMKYLLRWKLMEHCDSSFPQV